MVIMSSMKCRCGSGDKIKFKEGKMTRESDGKPHICLDEIDKVPYYKGKITELQGTITGLIEHNNYLQSKFILSQ